MSDPNTTVIGGRLTRNGELRYTPNGTPVCDLSVASNRVYYQHEQKKEETAFVDVTVWGKTAEALVPFFLKGNFLTITGRLVLDRWKDTDGKERSKLKVVANEIHLPPKSANSYGGGANNSEGSQGEAVGAGVGSSDDEDGEDVPF